MQGLHVAQQSQLVRAAARTAMVFKAIRVGARTPNRNSQTSLII